ncbi:MAG: 2-phosphosulfolactate phosphatase, partial [Cyclobacteriaceae bacterium]|nr:2-phosphosulfolactate phosphatase [Cyclobacteriaceae bacterium]
MTQLTTCLSPQLLPLHQIQDKIVVVVDILRATSSMVTAFAYNVESVT